MESQGEWSRHMYLVLNGGLEVTCKTKGKEDRPVTVTKLSAGHLWGEVALFMGEVSVFTITVVSPECQLLLITRESLQSLLPQHPHLHTQICRHVQELREAAERKAKIEKQLRVAALYRQDDADLGILASTFGHAGIRNLARQKNTLRYANSIRSRLTENGSPLTENGFLF